MKGNTILEMLKGLVLKVQSLSRTQAIIAATAAVVAVGGAGTGGYFLYENSHQPQETIADATTENEETEAPEEMTEEELIIAEVVMVTEETEAAEAEMKELSLIGTSMEKDLKIKIQDQNSKLVTGTTFVVTVAEDKNGAKSTEYEDKDQDGIIYIKDIKAGSYKVVLEDADGYTVKKGTITVTVKDKLAYEKVDVSGEIKTEKEVNTSIEDTAVNNVPVESVLSDTVALLDSTVTTTKTDGTQVDKSNFTAASASGQQHGDIKKTISTPETETPGGNTGSTEGTGSTDSTDSTDSTGSTGSTGSTDQTDSTGSTDSTDSTNTTNTTGTDSPTVSQPGAPEASVRKNSVTRVAEGEKGSATITLPTDITLYYGGGTASSSYTLNPTITGDAGIIKSISWGQTFNDAFSITKGSGYGAVVSYTGNGYGGGEFWATITFESDEAGNTAVLQMPVRVKITSMTDGKTQLKDKSGNALYIDSQAKTPATLKDYDEKKVYYTSPQYTGWQTRDGKVYYYDANHNAVTGNQVIGGVTYTFNSDGSLAQSSGSRGIDVSKWQGSIDWGAVAASGINFAIIRVGYRGASTGALIEDPYFKQNIAGATRAGIKVGVYFFTQAITEAEAVEEASMVLTLISGYKVSYPVFIDTESASNGRANGLDRNTRTAVVRAFCQTIASKGYKPGVYASKSWYNNQLNASSLSGYCIWVAQYNSSCTYSGKYDIWQHTSTGRVPGINGNVDLNIGYTKY